MVHNLKPIHSLVALYAHHEGVARRALADATREVRAAQAAVPPAPTAPQGRMDVQQWQAAQLSYRLSWQVLAHRLVALAACEQQQQRCNAEWWAARVRLQTVQRLLGRREAAQRSAALAIAQRRLDEAASVAWSGRQHVG